MNVFVAVFNGLHVWKKSYICRTLSFSMVRNMVNLHQHTSVLPSMQCPSPPSPRLHDGDNEGLKTGNSYTHCDDSLQMTISRNLESPAKRLSVFSLFRQWGIEGLSALGGSMIPSMDTPKLIEVGKPDLLWQYHTLGRRSVSLKEWGDGAKNRQASGHSFCSCCWRLRF